MRNFFHQTNSAIIRAVGWCLRWVCINRVQQQNLGTTELVIKKRRWFAQLPITIGNLIFRWRTPPVEVLSNKHWLAWEELLTQSIRNSIENSEGQSATNAVAMLRSTDKSSDRISSETGDHSKSDFRDLRSRGDLISTRLPGMPLAKLLQQIDQERKLAVKRKQRSPELPDTTTLASSWSDEELFCSVIQATRSLWRLHQISVPVRRHVNNHGDENFSLELFDARVSHGDATISNVIYHRSTTSAVWYDFDLRHNYRTDVDIRHADDLRALVYSASIAFPWPNLERLIASFHAAYPSPRVWQELKNQIARKEFAYDLFHWAQLNRSGGRYRYRAAEVTRAIEQLSLMSD